ncbi:hypothetical protein Tco_1341477 [Tanacetum coccineum]
MNKALALLAKAFKVNTIPTNNNQRSSLIPRNSQTAQQDMNTSQDIKMQMVDDNVGNQVRQNVVQYDANEVGQVECEFMAAADAYEETERVKVNCTLEDTLQQASPEEFDLMAATADLDEIEEVNANCILMANLQQASTSGT